MKYWPYIQYAIGILLLTLNSCNNESSDDNNYPRYVGDIAYEEEKDDASFVICKGEDRVKQYFNFGKGLQYKGEKRALVAQVLKAYEPVESDQSGWIRVRFIVNCKGETGWFRMTSSDLNYETQTFDERISSQLMEITKSLAGWKVLPEGKEPNDYYQYVSYKIQEGVITEILP